MCVETHMIGANHFAQKTKDKHQHPDYARLAAHKGEVPIEKWIDERGRIRIWAANTGAHHTGDLSLDYRLKDVPVIKDQTVRILLRLEELLQTLEKALEEDWGEITQEEALRILEDQLDGDQNIADLKFNESEVSHIFKTIVETVTQLYQISMVISPLPDHDRLMETENLDYVLRAIQRVDGESILSKLPVTSTNDDIGTEQILLRCQGTQYPLPVPKISVTKGEVTVGVIRAMAAEKFGITDTNRIRLIFKGNLFKSDSQVLGQTCFEQSQEIMCIIPPAEGPSRGDDLGYDNKHSDEPLREPAPLSKTSYSGIKGGQAMSHVFSPSVW
ncbi:uncharacterized protein N7479_004962 [Penicillium vulpinum]|uniref:uncharacterized protein n=1 Tax=Penicillium vulpinum TaxID=29845 RepID=UPI0025469C22|nr:uncharacterized protein N7479_004962 [Penicillium vulpinum]KAJ5965086.1 hypothetical protein N7479_004962 [Penicillium vulpinum]